MHEDVTPDATPFEIADRLLLVKEQEADWKARRIALELRLVEALGFDKPKGAKTYTLQDDLEVLKVTCDQPIYATIDPAAWVEVAPLIPEELQPIRLKYEPIAASVKVLREEHSELYLLFCRAYSTKPGKVQVSFKS